MAWFKKDKKEEENIEPKKIAPVLKTGKVVSDVILRPMVTEKAAHLAAKGQYVFVVSQNATKIQVRNAVRTMYGMTPTSVNIQRVEGKIVRFGRAKGKRKNWKKAIVTLPKGKKIEVYEGV
jgi:large subunit ribosomal protein L23